MKRINDQKETWNFALFVRGKEPASLLAFQALTRLCDRHLRGKCTIDIVDVELHPRQARREGIEQTPTLLKRGPPPRIELCGELHEAGQMAADLGLVE
jgi:circadian clock protein KaiB